MKKNACFLLVSLCVIALLCSCLTTYASDGEVSEKDANEAIQVVLIKAVQNANTRFFQKVNTYSFFPQSYSIIVEAKDNIPGMNSIIDSWNSYVASYLDEEKEEIQKQTEKYVRKMTITNEFELVNSSNTSGTEYLDRIAQKDFSDLLIGLVEGMDFSKLNAAVSQYNAWVKTENFVNKKNLKTLDQRDVTQELVSIIYETYKKTVEMYEELYRTTPDPYTEDIILKVFRLN